MANTPLGESVLLVGKKTLDFDLIHSHMGHFGIRCTQAASAADALYELEQGRFDFIVLDDSLSEHSAMELIAELERQHPHIPLMTFGNPGGIVRDLEKQSARGMARVANLSKPVSLRQLDNALMSRWIGTMGDKSASAD